MSISQQVHSVTPLNNFVDDNRNHSTMASHDTSGDLLTGLIAAQATVRPHSLAVQASNGALSHAELDGRANQLAWHLRSLGVGPEAVVAVYITRSTSLVVSQLAILKAGGAYLPLDPSLPADRLAFILEDSQAGVVLTEQKLANRVAHSKWGTVVIDGESVDMEKHSATPPPNSVTPENLAYLIYTSGSTGRPKGVEVTHANLSKLISWHNRAFAVTHVDRASQLANLGFDAAVWEIWPYLASGAALCLSDDHTLESPEVLRDWLVANAITVSFVPTPLAEEIMRLDWPRATRLRLLLIGGDTLHRYPSANLPFAVVNNYGPTECTVVSTSGLVTSQQESAGLPCIGRPVPHADVYILDEQRRQIPPGTPGELYIGGAGVARGYRNRPDLTVEKFIPSQFRPGTRLYRTGDLGRYLPDGQIAFLGRVDDQVKIRGYRIEPDEIAVVLNSHPEIRMSTVVAREDRPGEKRLVGYIVTTGHLSRSAVQEFLRAQLPDYMVPATFVVLQAMPLTSNGKIDRVALPRPIEENVLRDETFAPPHSKVELQLCAIVCSLLDLSQIGLDDNFFLRGGHSLLGTQLIARVRQAFDIELPLRLLFEHPTVRELAAGVQELLFEKAHNMSDDEAKQVLGSVAKPGKPCAPTSCSRQS